VDFYGSLALSCDVFYYQLAQRLGPDALAQLSRAFGLGQRTGIDLPHERSGLVPDTQWKRERFKQPWFGGETLNYGIGQGYLTITPLQGAVMAMGLANRGVMYRPHLVKAIRSEDGARVQTIEPEVIHRYEASPQHWDAVIEGMVRVVERGTAGAARVPGVRVAGKTGSAEFRKGGKTHAWFIAFAPAENPRVAICVLAEEAGGGGRNRRAHRGAVAALLLRTRLLNRAYRLRLGWRGVRRVGCFGDAVGVVSSASVWRKVACASHSAHSSMGSHSRMVCGSYSARSLSFS
jgi:penicillin-binding protein 2